MLASVILDARSGQTSNRRDGNPLNTSSFLAKYSKAYLARSGSCIGPIYFCRPSAVTCLDVIFLYGVNRDRHPLFFGRGISFFVARFWSRTHRSWQSSCLVQAPCGRRLLRRSAYRCPPRRVISVISTSTRRATWADGAGYGALTIRKVWSRGTPIGWTPLLTCLLTGRLLLTSTHCESAPR